MSDRPVYRQAGVDYGVLDEGKRSALRAALATSSFLAASGHSARDDSRGEPAFVFAVGSTTLAFVLEGLGTKSIVAREVAECSDLEAFDAVAYDAVAAVLNDLVCVGALPLVLNAYFATGHSNWYSDGARFASLVEGWRRACEDAECTWGGGESPSLPGLVAGTDIELAGAAVGLVPEAREPILGGDLAPGDDLVLVASSGLHANGASLARMVASQAPDGWNTRLGDGRRFGEAILTPSVLYVPLVRALLASEIRVRYLSHITGHGLQKLMRPQRDLSYRVTDLPPVPIELSFIADATGMSPRDAYGTLNMGSGFAVYAPAGDGARVVDMAQRLGLSARVAGRVEDGPRRVTLEPLGVVFDEHEMSLSAS